MAGPWAGRVAALQAFAFAEATDKQQASCAEVRLCPPSPGTLLREDNSAYKGNIMTAPAFDLVPTCRTSD